MRWYLPSFSGDFRLIPAEGKPDRSTLIVVEPTSLEVEHVSAFLARARKKKWIDAQVREAPAGDPVYKSAGMHIDIGASVAKAGAVLAKIVRPKKATLTAVKFVDGRLETVEGTGVPLEQLADKAEAEGAKAATTVRRPTPSCPACVPGSVEMASEVLLEFLDDEQHADWAKHRAILVHGGTTGRRYLIAHRHSETAVRNGRITFDVEARCVIHFHDSLVPPEEEVLAAKLILEHREHWLRNEATVLGYFGAPDDMADMQIFKNPFGDVQDGIPDAKFSQGFGLSLAQSLGVDLGPNPMGLGQGILAVPPSPMDGTILNDLLAG